MTTKPTAVRTFTSLLAAVLLIAGASPAFAGCLKEFGECGDCAEKAMVEAVMDLDVGDAIDAYVDAIDCDIDLLHCILYDSHHEYDCGL